MDAFGSAAAGARIAARAGGKAAPHGTARIGVTAAASGAGAVWAAGFASVSEVVAMATDGQRPRRSHLVGDPLAPFEINASTGAITVADPSGLTAGENWVLVVRATDANGAYGQASLTLEVLAEIAAYVNHAFGYQVLLYPPASLDDGAMQAMSQTLTIGDLVALGILNRADLAAILTRLPPRR